MDSVPKGPRSPGARTQPAATHPTPSPILRAARSYANSLSIHTQWYGTTGRGGAPSGTQRRALNQARPHSTVPFDLPAGSRTEPHSGHTAMRRRCTPRRAFWPSRQSLAAPPRPVGFTALHFRPDSLAWPGGGRGGRGGGPCEDSRGSARAALAGYIPRAPSDPWPSA